MIDQVTIAHATSQDLDTLQLLVQRAYRGAVAALSWSHEGQLPGGERVSRDALAGLIGSPSHILSVAELGDRLVGTVLVECDGPERCSIGLLGVEPDLQGRGIGDQLLRHAEREAVGRFGAVHAFIEVLDQKPKLIAYYERRGYRPTGAARPYPHLLEPPAELLIFRKRLQPAV